MAEFSSYFQSEEMEYYSLILKGKFKAVETNVFGLFVIFFDENTRSVERLTVIASHFSSIYDMDPESPWNTLEENLLNLKWKGDIAVPISLDLQNYLENALSQDRGNELFSFTKSNEATKIETLLQAIMMKPLSDRNIIIDVSTEVVSKESIRAAREERRKATVKVPNKEKSHDTIEVPIRRADIVDAQLVLAPVSGIPIQELAIGERIMVKISANSTLGNYYIDSFGARVDGNIIPVAAEVIDIDRGKDKEYILLCKLDENVYGKIIETEPVMIKKYDELLLPLTVPHTTSHSFLKSRKTFLFFVVITGGLIFILLFLFLFLWLNNLL